MRRSGDSCVSSGASAFFGWSVFFLRRNPYLPRMSRFSFLSILSSIVILSSLPQSQENRRILVDKSDYRLAFYRNNQLQRTFRIAVGKNPGDKQRRGDFRTPEGRFRISQIQDSRAWVHDFNDGKGPIAGAYGPWFLRLKWDGDPSSIAQSWIGIGIHGTHDSASIGTMATEGCIRLKNAELEELVRSVTVGTTVEIVP